ncbi:NUMOD3 domain-containing DNA-binding protein [Clostridium tepidum]|uniref:NUMOD3 domain-containing DNA-binding protein n=1 Tax=Clostridium tepidum TaxID=1962263 RepID=UPI00214A1598|nr:NUMOD3 domain-containing DNA-binding protein [Clostridium tepidum]MCR1933536.1 NUMOD3 domain-containing DNA-binding protein [Clostridium tepidum]
MKEIINPYGFIYITTNMINGKRYIGQKKFREKWQLYLGSGVALKNAIKKYGRENFNRDIVDIAYSSDELNDLEIKWIENYKAYESDDFYNIADGGKSGNTFAGKSDKEMKVIKNKIRNSRIGVPLKKETKIKLSKIFKGRKFSDETCKKISDSLTGRKLDEETKRKISKTRKLNGFSKGKNNPMYGVHLCGEKHSLYGTHLSEERKQKQSQIMKAQYASGERISPMKGKNHTEVTKRKISKTKIESGVNKGKNNPRAKRVICITTGKVFDTMKEGARYYNIKSLGNLSNNIKNNKSCGNLNGVPLMWKIQN